MDSNALENALKQIQNWFVSGEFDKVVRGCKEVLNVAPSNSIAQDLLKKAEESMQTAPAPTLAHVPAPTPAPNEDIPTPPAMEPTYVPEAPMPTMSMPEPIPEAPMPEPIPLAPEELISVSMPEDEEHHKLHSLLVNLAILIGIIVIGFSAVLGYHTFFGDKDDTPPPATTETEPQTPEKEPDGKPGPEPSEDTSDDANSDDAATDDDAMSETPTGTQTREQAYNAQRNNDLVMMENALIRYYDEFKKYPNADALETELVQGGYLEALPTPPTSDEAYMYAVYSTPIGPNQQFILSAEFKEGSSTTIWTTGANIQDYPDYRDDSKPNVLAITNPDAVETETAPQTPVNPADIRVPRTPRPPRAS